MLVLFTQFDRQHLNIVYILVPLACGYTGVLFCAGAAYAVAHAVFSRSHKLSSQLKKCLGRDR